VSIRSPSDAHGLVRPWERGRSFELASRPPCAALERLVDRFWSVRWDLENGTSFEQEILPHPSLNLVVEPDRTCVWGVPTHRARRQLHGRGWAVGTKFKPGVFTALTGIEAARITNSSISVSDAFGNSPELDDFDLATAALSTIASTIEAWLLPMADVDNPSLTLIDQIVASMRALPPDVRVQQIASANHLAPRTLQRLFHRYVGVSPKWVLKRLRIHEATERLAVAMPPAWTKLALDLGYYDHAHFIRDFRLVVGRSPVEYAREAAAARTLASGNSLPAESAPGSAGMR
jgi:AraC-like DNA-binding protein